MFVNNVEYYNKQINAYLYLDLYFAYKINTIHLCIPAVTWPMQSQGTHALYTHFSRNLINFNITMCISGR